MCIVHSGGVKVACLLFRNELSICGMAAASVIMSAICHVYKYSAHQAAVVNISVVYAAGTRRVTAVQIIMPSASRYG